MEFKKYKMAMRNRISPKNRDFVIDRERAPFDDNVSNLGEQPVLSQNEFTTTPMIDPAEFPARKEYMQSYAVGGNVRQLFEYGTYPGSDLELYHSEIKKLWLEGNSLEDIVDMDKKKFKNPQQVLRAIQSMQNGKSPVKISKEEVKNKLNPKNKFMNKVKEAYDELVLEYQEKGLNQKPTKTTLAKKAGVSMTATTNAVDKFGLDIDQGMTGETKKTMSEKRKKTIDEQIKTELKNKLVVRYNKDGSIKSFDGPEKLKQDYISELIERLKSPIGKDYRKAGNFLSDAQLAKKYDIAENTIPKLNKFLKSEKKLSQKKVTKKGSDLLRERREFITQGGKKIQGIGKTIHHMTPIGGEADITSKQITFLDRSTNSRIGQTNQLLNRYADSVSDALNDSNLTNSEKVKMIDDLNVKQQDVIDNLPKKYKGIVGYQKAIPSLDEYGTVYDIKFEPTGVDVSKAIPGPEVKLKDIPTGSYTKKELTGKVQEVSDNLLGIIGCSNSSELQPRSKLTRTENSVGGRIGFANGPKPGNGCIEKGKKKLEEGRIGKTELNAVERSLEQSGKMTPAAQKFFTAAKTALKTGSRIPAELISLGFGPYGVVAGALLELATVQDQIRRGNLKQAWRETFPGMILKGAENLAGIDLTGSRRTDIIKYAKTPEEIAAVNAMYKYSEDVDKYNEMLGDLDLIGGDILANEQLQEPEADLMTSLSSQQFYDVEDRAKKLNELLDFQEKIATSPEVQKLANMPLYREAKDKFKIAQEFYPNLTFEEFFKGESGDAYYNEGEPQYNKFVAPNIIIDPDTEFMRQPFAGGGLSIQDKIQELLASIPGLMIADFVPVSEKVQLKRLFDQFNDRYMRKAEGGRIGFKNGPEDINKSRRLFNQLLLGLAALPVVGKYLKLGRGAGKVANITINKTAGMPEFFEPLVNKVINEGIDITQKMSTQERQTVHLADIADHEVTVYRQLDTGEIDVYINGMKTLYQDAVRLYYKPGQISEEASKAAGKPIKEADEFIAQESSPAYSGSPEDYEITSDGTFETNNFNELASDLTEVEAAVMKQPVTELQKRKKLEKYKYYESKEGTQKLLDEQYGEYDDTMRDDVIDE